MVSWWGDAGKKYTEKSLLIVEISSPCSDQIFKSARIRDKIVKQPHQFRKAAQLWLLEVVEFAVEAAPLFLLYAGKCVRTVERKAVKKVVTETHLDRTTE